MGVTTYDALGLVDFYPVPHYESFPFENIVQDIIDTYSSELNLVPISNYDAILVLGDSVKIERK
ncbi:MAG: Type 1 glutamine amidotransferase-like domain-containing protein [Oscillospiraceae bacterium]